MCTQRASQISICSTCFNPFTQCRLSLLLFVLFPNACLPQCTRAAASTKSITETCAKVIFGCSVDETITPVLSSLVTCLCRRTAHKLDIQVKGKGEKFAPVLFLSKHDRSRSRAATRAWSHLLRQIAQFHSPFLFDLFKERALCQTQYVRSASVRLCTRCLSNHYKWLIGNRQCFSKIAL